MYVCLHLKISYHLYTLCCRYTHCMSLYTLRKHVTILVDNGGNKTVTDMDI